MANELRVVLSIKAAKDFRASKHASKLIDVSGDCGNRFIQVVGTSYENLQIAPDIGTVGIVVLKNWGNTNLQVDGLGSGNAGAFVPSGSFALLRGSGGTIKLKSDTSSNVVECIVIED